MQLFQESCEILSLEWWEMFILCYVRIIHSSVGQSNTSKSRPGSKSLFCCATLRQCWSCFIFVLRYIGTVIWFLLYVCLHSVSTKVQKWACSLVVNHEKALAITCWTFLSVKGSSHLVCEKLEQKLGQMLSILRKRLSFLWLSIESFILYLFRIRYVFLLELFPVIGSFFCVVP